MPSFQSKAIRIALISLAVVAAGVAWIAVRDRVLRTIAAFELARFGGWRLAFEVDLDRGLAQEADRLATELEESVRETAPGATIRQESGARNEIVLTFADALAARRFAQSAPPEILAELAQAGDVSADRELRFVLADEARDLLLNRLRRTIASRLQTVTGHTVLVQSHGPRLLADLPARAAAQLQRYEAAQPTRGALRNLFVSARLEFRVVDDGDARVAHLGQRPPGISLDWDRYQGPGSALVTAPYLSSKDPDALRAFVHDKAPPGRVLAISRTAGEAGGYRTFLLHDRARLTGDYIAEARVAFDGPAEHPRPYVQVTFNDRGARLFGKLTTEHVLHRVAIVLDEDVESAPIIQTPITGGLCSIHLGGTKPVGEALVEAKDLSLVLRSGALAAPVRLVSAEPIAPGRRLQAR